MFVSRPEKNMHQLNLIQQQIIIENDLDKLLWLQT